MACKEGNVQPQHFVEEIDYNEIKKIQVVGKGSFGVVWKGKWRNIDVAVKHIDSEAEKKAFAVEVRQLSRINHPNIVKLYGACTQNPNPVCLVMEYAEGGSLYNVLHCRPLPKYTAGHAMSWALQCANGVAYLHNMKPKALIHRDLKPPNLLLIMGGKVLKICDFGTACDKKTYMTNNKGSAAWMAPEVFEGSSYTEKCDVFSWGIILWEVLSRRKPFDDIGGSAYRIMWAVHTGERPPLIEGCPRPIESLMTRCWDKNPANRPSMDEVVHIMNALFPFFTGYDEPVQYSSGDEESSQGSALPEEYDSDDEDTQAEMGTTLTDRSKTQVSSTSTMNGSIMTQGKTELVAESLKKPLQIEVDPYPWTLEPKDQDRGRRSTEGIRLREPNPYIGWQSDDDMRKTTPGTIEIMKTAGLDKSVPVQNAPTSGSSSTTHEELDNVYLMLDPQLHPISPDNTCKESVQIFEEHKRLAQEYLKVQTEIAYLSRHMDQLAERLSEAEGLSQLDQQDSERLQEELRKLENEKENLQKLHRNLKRQLELIKGQRRESVGNDGWVVVPHQDHSHLT
ncbi:mitogen-activated protein kinase kinase kinase 7-like [Schistocerca americana]|uniref:mitogen-activated protein kinase kinase kinase 7-like n=1 Tax=Schistocerca americana TaxID=7009 RepID=UPI001F4FD2FC|nr:mitogen-activated protein kinase kinase kinase 7-like [Schistocerca americana]